jgi:hypothetical protein
MLAALLVAKGLNRVEPRWLLGRASLRALPPMSQRCPGQVDEPFGQVEVRVTAFGVTRNRRRKPRASRRFPEENAVKYRGYLRILFPVAGLAVSGAFGVAGEGFVFGCAAFSEGRSMLNTLIPSFTSRLKPEVSA